MLFCHPNKQMWACVPWKNRVLQPSDKIAMKPSPFNWQLTDFFRNTNIFQYSRVWIKKTRVWMRWKSTFIPLLQKELSHHSRSYETCATGTVLFVCCYCQSSSWHSGIDMHKIKHTCLNYTQEQETALYLQGTVAWLVHLLTLKWSVFMLLVLPLWKPKGKVSSDLFFFYCRQFESSLEIMIILICYNPLLKASHHFCFQPVGNLLSCYN